MVKYTGWRRGGSRRKTRGIFGRRFGYTKRFDKGITYGIRVAWEINCFPGGGGKKYFPLLPFSFLSLPPLMYSDIRRETTACSTYAGCKSVQLEQKLYSSHSPNAMPLIRCMLNRRTELQLLLPRMGNNYTNIPGTIRASINNLVDPDASRNYS